MQWNIINNKKGIMNGNCIYCDHFATYINMESYFTPEAIIMLYLIKNNKLKNEVLIHVQYE